MVPDAAGLRVVDFRLWAVGCGLRTVGCAGFGAGLRQRGRRFAGRIAAEALDIGSLGAGGLG
ncbi:hypothetical protein DYI21_16605 [Thalassospira tepidiphila]|nr:hypothetical protein [Thalassospira tepidiphila]